MEGKELTGKARAMTENVVAKWITLVPNYNRVRTRVLRNKTALGNSCLTISRLFKRSMRRVYPRMRRSQGNTGQTATVPGFQIANLLAG
eukprot:6200391-Pleurochrysis_carterae.AAC.2